MSKRDVMPQRGVSVGHQNVRNIYQDHNAPSILYVIMLQYANLLDHLKASIVHCTRESVHGFCIFLLSF